MIEFEGHDLCGLITDFWLIFVCLGFFLKHQLEESEEHQAEERGAWLHASVGEGGLRDDSYRKIFR